MTAHPSPTTLTQRVNALVSRYTVLSAQRKTQATCHKAEASYLYGAAAAFEVVATELWEALGGHGAVPQVARVPRSLSLAKPPVDSSSADDPRSPGVLVEATVHASPDGEEAT